MSFPHIGFKTWNVFYTGTRNYMDEVPAVEVAAKDENFNFRRKDLNTIKDRLKGKHLSLHTQTKRVFTETDQTLRDLEMATLKAEILACRYLGCHELIVHLKQEKLTSEEITTFSHILQYAQNQKVDILYEPNSNCNGENFLYNVKQLPELNINLDLCHLAMAAENKTLGMHINEFIDNIKNKTVYIHASGYDGNNEHVGLNKSTLDWQNVLDTLDLHAVRKIVIELHKYEDFDATYEALKPYFH